MTTNIENWTYKSKKELEALNDDQLLKVEEELGFAIREFRRFQINLTDEMVWQLMVVPSIVHERGLKGRIRINESPIITNLTDDAITLEVPEDAHSFEIYENNIIGGVCVMYLQGNPDTACRYSCNLPAGNWFILGKPEEITFEQSEKLMKDFTGSLYLLLQEKNINPVNVIILLRDDRIFGAKDCLTHKREVAGISNMTLLAEMIGNLHYQTLAELLFELQTKFHKDSMADLAKKRFKLAHQLRRASKWLYEASFDIENAWQISKPYMKEKK